MRSECCSIIDFIRMRSSSYELADGGRNDGGACIYCEGGTLCGGPGDGIGIECEYPGPGYP